jgi:diguanylate cyclase (GGDEF)-like protein
MSTDDMTPDRSDQVSASEWLLLSMQESDTVLVSDAEGVCTWTSGVPWVGRRLSDLIMIDGEPGLRPLLSEAPSGPLWIRRSAAVGETVWLHAVSTPRVEGGWVVQIRQPRALATGSKSAVPGVDGVTGVAGREHALNEVGFLLSATPRTGKETAVACCGLDGFAALNERLGVAAGDEVLRVVAGRISDTLRSGDLVARLDTDRFLVVLRGVHHLRGAIRVANKVRAVVEDPIPLAGGMIEQTMSVGVTIISRGESVDSVMERAEGALGMAKDAGGNVVTSSPPI